MFKENYSVIDKWLLSDISECDINVNLSHRHLIFNKVPVEASGPVAAPTPQTPGGRFVLCCLLKSSYLF